MNQSKAFLTSLIFAGLAMLLVYFYVTEQENAIKKDFGDEVAVWVASRDVNELEEFRPEMLTTMTIPRKFVQPTAMIVERDKEKNNAIKSPDVFGAVASGPFRKGEQVLLSKLLLKGAETGLASQVAITRRAMSIPVSNVTGVTKLLKPGDRVDLIANVAYRGPAGQESEIKTLMQNVHVLAVGEMIQNQVPSAFENDPLTQNRKAINLRGSRAFDTVTVEITPPEAQSLIYVLQSGSEIYLTLRNPVDRVVQSVPTTTVDEVLGPNSKKAEKERSRFVKPAPVTTKPLALPPPNPWSQGGGSFVK